MGAQDAVAYFRDVVEEIFVDLLCNGIPLNQRFCAYDLKGRQHVLDNQLGHNIQRFLLLGRVH